MVFVAWYRCTYVGLEAHGARNVKPWSDVPRLGCLIERAGLCNHF